MRARRAIQVRNYVLALGLLALGAAGCHWNWDALEPPPDARRDAGGSARLDAVAASESSTGGDSAPDTAVACGGEGEPCCAGEDARCRGATACVSGTCGPCGGTLTACNGACVDLQTNRQNCGACGQRCTRGGQCSNGRCP